jgi:cyclic pyranopterin phosphate synthase
MSAPVIIADRLGRMVRYVRVSVTDRCDMRCVYCMPAGGLDFMKRAELLTYEEIERIITVLAPAGVRSVRITGGEPLVRHDIVELIERVAAVAGVQDVAMTTNARLLPRYAQALADAGLRRINVSLDSVDRETFKTMTRGDHLPDVLAGIEAALDAGLAPIKINAVVVRGQNDHQVADIVRYSRAHDLQPRFIEIMPMQGADWFGPERLVSSQEVRDRLVADGLELAPLETAPTVGSGPARHLQVREAADPTSPWTEVGFISPITENFCDSCNRIRITPTGGIRACLGWDDALSLRDLMRNGVDDAGLMAAISASLLGKRESHDFDDKGSGGASHSMSAVGG